MLMIMKENLLQPAIITLTAFTACALVYSLFNKILRVQVWKGDTRILILWLFVFVVSSFIMHLIVREKKGWIWQAFSNQN